MDDSKKIDMILTNLKANYPEIDWQTEIRKNDDISLIGISP